MHCLPEIEFFYKLSRSTTNEELVDLIAESLCVEISSDDGNKKKSEITSN